LTGEIEADGSFIMRTKRLMTTKPAGLARSPADGVTREMTVSGKAPPAGSTNWSGNYTITGQMNPRCIWDGAGNFTASLLPPLTGTFFGEYGRFGSRHKFSITTTQGDFVSHDASLPLSGTIHIDGSSCFADGRTDASGLNHMQGDLAFLRFRMDDGSALSLSMVYTDPQGRELSIMNAGVTAASAKQ
jgi:hypothetical protein